VPGHLKGYQKRKVFHRKHTKEKAAKAGSEEKKRAFHTSDSLYCYFY